MYFVTDDYPFTNIYIFLLSSSINLFSRLFSPIKVVSAEGEQNAARVLREAANIMDESPATLQLRYLQTLNSIAGQQNHTYVFPLPIDLIAKFFSK